LTGSRRGDDKKGLGSRPPRPSRVQGYDKLNWLWRRIAGWLSKRCEGCGKPRLYSIFDAYISGSGPDCIRCSSAYLLAYPLIRWLFHGTSISSAHLKEMMSDELIRRSMLNVVQGIHHFGLQEPQPTAIPVVIVWNFTNRCNLNCLHCHQSSGTLRDGELSTDEALRAIDRMGAKGVSILTFSGGEPLVRPDIYDAIERARHSGMLCTIASNGTLMTKEVVRKLKAAGIRRVEIGLDGCRPETHDFLRNQPGAFERTIEGIRNCVEEGFDEVCATMTLHSGNVDELEGTVKLAEDLGVNRFYLNRLIPAGRGKNLMGLDVTREQKIKALEFLYGRFASSVLRDQGIQCYCRGMTYYGRLGYERSGGRVYTVSEALSGHSRMWRQRYGTDISGLVGKFVAGFGGCSAGITYAGLTADGFLQPCVPAPVKLGNILEEDLEEIWINNETLRYMRRRNQLKGACGDCGYNFVCGGCRYTAFVQSGDWLAADPSCPFGPHRPSRVA
jgi:radical SAM protein with 4Fe4S-binding SPASM domain